MKEAVTHFQCAAGAITYLEVNEYSCDSNQCNTGITRNSCRHSRSSPLSGLQLALTDLQPASLNPSHFSIALFPPYSLGTRLWNEVPCCKQWKTDWRLGNEVAIAYPDIFSKFWIHPCCLCKTVAVKLCPSLWFV